MRRCTHHVLTFCSLGGEESTGQTSYYDKVLRGDCTVVMVLTFIDVLEIW